MKDLPSYMVVVICPECNSYDIEEKGYGVYECKECFTSFDKEHIKLEQIDPDVEFGELSDTTVMLTEEEQKKFAEEVYEMSKVNKLDVKKDKTQVFRTSYKECPKCKGMMQNSKEKPCDFKCLRCNHTEYKIVTLDNEEE